MEEGKTKIWFVTLMLTVIAGYCDSITFVAADKIFSAHVTGNFIVFAYQMIQGSDVEAWIKLLTFPIFMLSVMAGGWISARFLNKHLILFWEGVLLVASGAIYYLLGNSHEDAKWLMYVVTMLVVFAMGLQNAFGKLFAKDTYGPTTMMTGNVTQFALDLRSFCNSGFINGDALSGVYKGLITLCGFLLGCVLGAWAGKTIGLFGILFPGVAMIICYFSTNKKTIVS